MEGDSQQLLVAPLDGAVPVAQLDHVPLPVGHDLELDVAGVDDQLLQVHLPAAEAGQRLAAGLFKQGDELLRLIHPAHPPASTAGGGLDEHRVSNGVGQGPGLLGGVYRPVGAGPTGTPALCISFRAAALLPMARITSPEGPMKVMPAASQASAKSAFSLRKP